MQYIRIYKCHYTSIGMYNACKRMDTTCKHITGQVYAVYV